METTNDTWELQNEAEEIANPGAAPAQNKEIVNILADEPVIVAEDINFDFDPEADVVSNDKGTTNTGNTSPGSSDGLKNEPSSRGQAQDTAKKYLNGEIIVRTWSMTTSRIFPFIPPFKKTLPKHWALTEEEMKDLIPLVNEVIKDMDISEIKPIWLLLFVMLTIYGTKGFDLWNYEQGQQELDFENNKERIENEAKRADQAHRKFSTTVRKAHKEHIEKRSNEVKLKKDGTPKKKPGPKKDEDIPFYETETVR